MTHQTAKNCIQFHLQGDFAPDGLPALFGVLRLAALGVIYAHGAWLAKCKPGCARPDPVLLKKSNSVTQRLC